MSFGFKKGSRVNILSTVLFLSIAVITIRLFQIQIIDHKKYTEMADKEQIKRLVIPAKRGQIYALNGESVVPLALNEVVYTVFADPSVVKDPKKVEQVVKEVAGGNVVTNIMEDLSQTDSRYKVLATKLSRAQAEMIKSNDLSGVGFHEMTQRVYPEGQLASQVLGFVNLDGEGQYGIEGSLDDRLEGEDGLLETVTDVNSVPLTIGDKNVQVAVKNGDNLVLSIDQNVQYYVEQALKRGLENVGADEGSVIVMDPNSGAVLAMANYPTYNPSEYTKVKDAALFSNPIVMDPYEPGSVIKAFTVTTGLDKGVISPSSTYNNTGSITVEDRTIENAYKGMYGTVTMQDVLNWSLNTGVITIAQRLGDGDRITKTSRDTIYEYFHDRFLFGQKTGIELGEYPGSIHSPDTVEGNAVRYSNMTFGHGMDLTMLQVASALGAVVNGGTYYEPTILSGTYNDGIFDKKDPKVKQSGVVQASTSKQIIDMLVTARSSNYSLSGGDRPGYMIGGKTGTSETLIDGSYTKGKTIASYLGFGGDTSAKYVIMVRVKDADKMLEGAIDAGPIFTDISNWMIKYLMLRPRS